MSLMANVVEFDKIRGDFPDGQRDSSIPISPSKPP